MLALKLNHDLIRDLLLYIEDKSDGQQGFAPDDFCAAFPAEPPLTVKYHLKYLADAGLVERVRAYILDITPLGRNYLDNIRSQSVWEVTKQRFQPLGSVTLDVISEIAKAAVLSHLGL